MKADWTVYDIEAEMLACLLMDNTLIDVFDERVNEDDISAPKHRLIWSTIKTLLTRNIPANYMTVRNELEAAGKLEAAGGDDYLLKLTSDHLPFLSNAESYAAALSDMARVRAARAALEHLNGATPATAGEALDRFEAAVLAAGEKRGGRNCAKRIGEIATEVFAETSQAATRGRSAIGIRSGLVDLDGLLGPMTPGQLILVAGRPSMGKSALAAGVALGAAKAGHPVAFFSLEMSAEQVARRLLAAEAGIDQTLLQTGRLSSDAWRPLSEVCDGLQDVPLTIDDSPALTVMALRAKCRRIASRSKLGLVVVDYLQLMHSGLKRESREQDVAEISRSLKALARELQCSVMALSQLNRAVEGRSDKRPTLADLRESGALEQDADAVLMIYREEVYQHTDSNYGIAEIHLAKNRTGPIGNVRCRFERHLCRFVDRDTLKGRPDSDSRESYTTQ